MSDGLSAARRSQINAWLAAKLAPLGRNAHTEHAAVIVADLLAEVDRLLPIANAAERWATSQHRADQAEDAGQYTHEFTVEADDALNALYTAALGLTEENDTDG
jgi:hypothetical protein